MVQLTRALNHPQTTAEIAQLSQAVVVCHVSQLPPYQLQFHLQTRKKEQDLEYILVWHQKDNKKNSVTLLFTRTQEMTDRYIALIAFKNGPDKPAFTSDKNRDVRFTELKAFCKSINATYNFPPFLLKYFSMTADNVYIWSMVEYPFLNPAWASTAFSWSSIHLVSLFRKTVV